MTTTRDKASDVYIMTMIEADPNYGIKLLLKKRAGIILAGVYACGIPIDAETAESVIADLIIFVWLNAAKFDPKKGSLNSWLIGVAYRNALTLHRQKFKNTISPERLGEIEYKPQSHPSRFSRAQNREVRRVLHEMAPRQRVVIEADMASPTGRGETKELCAKLGCKPNALYDIRLRAHRKFKSLRDRFGL